MAERELLPPFAAVWVACAAHVAAALERAEDLAGDTTLAGLVVLALPLVAWRSLARAAALRP